MFTRGLLAQDSDAKSGVCLLDRTPTPVDVQLCGRLGIPQGMTSAFGLETIGGDGT